MRLQTLVQEVLCGLHSVFVARLPCLLGILPVVAGRRLGFGHNRVARVGLGQVRGHDGRESLQDAQTETRVREVEVERNVARGRDQKTENLLVRSVEALQEVDDTEDNGFVHQAFLHLWKLENDRSESRQVVFSLH